MLELDFDFSHAKYVVDFSGASFVVHYFEFRSQIKVIWDCGYMGGGRLMSSLKCFISNHSL